MHGLCLLRLLEVCQQPARRPRRGVSAPDGRLLSVRVAARCRASGFVLGTVVACALVDVALVLPAPPAAALGDATADHYIIADPEPGWIPIPMAEDQQALQQAQDGGASHGLVGVAVQGWSSPGGSQALIVVLARYGSDVTVSDMPAAVQSLSQECSGDTPEPVVADPQIPNSQEIVCNQQANLGGPSGSIFWYEANVAVIMLGNGAFGQSSLEAAASAQYVAIPSGGIDNGGFPVWPVPLVLVPVVGGAIGYFLRSKRRSRTGFAAAGSPPAPASWARPGYPSGAPAASGYPPAATAYPPAASRTPPTAPAPAEAWARTAAPTARVAVLASTDAAGGPADLPHQAVGAMPGGAGASSAAPQMRWGPEGTLLVPAPQATAAPEVDAHRSGRPIAASAGGYGDNGPAPGAAGTGGGRTPGWYQVGGPYELRYFDGSSWIAHKRWNGEAWVDLK